MTATPITIIGGGLAGLALGIGLKQRGVPVTIREAGRYPRHRVCGEFISGQGQESLARLGLLPAVKSAGGISAVSAAFFAGARKTPVRMLPQPALCLSRFTLDRLLAEEFQRLDGKLVVGERWQGGFGDGIVRATGRRAETAGPGPRLFGIKVHAHGIALEADLEMHLLPSGYVGLCRLAGGEVNVCGLFQTSVPVPELAKQWREWLGGPVGSVLRQRLASARFDETSFCSVAGLSLRPRQAMLLEECSVGDALTMIPPVTGNGMSMAFESAELAMEPLTRFGRGEQSWLLTRQQVAQACDSAFARRLHWASRLQPLLLQPLPRLALLWLAGCSESIWRTLFKLTR